MRDACGHEQRFARLELTFDPVAFEDALTRNYDVKLVAIVRLLQVRSLGPIVAKLERAVLQQDPIEPVV